MFQVKNRLFFLLRSQQNLRMLFVNGYVFPIPQYVKTSLVFDDAIMNLQVGAAHLL